jgi:hypothetical protein
MLKIIQRFDKHFSCHLQSEYVMVGYFGGGHAVAEELDLMELICGTEERQLTYLLKLGIIFQHSARLIPERRSCTPAAKI